MAENNHDLHDDDMARLHSLLHEIIWPRAQGYLSGYKELAQILRIVAEVIHPLQGQAPASQAVTVTTMFHTSPSTQHEHPKHQSDLSGTAKTKPMQPMDEPEFQLATELEHWVTPKSKPVELTIGPQSTHKHSAEGELLTSPSKKQKITVTEQGSPVALSLQPKPMEIGLEVDSNTAEFEMSESVKSAEPTEETIQDTAKMPEGPSKPSKHLAETPKSTWDADKFLSMFMSGTLTGGLMKEISPANKPKPKVAPSSKLNKPSPKPTPSSKLSSKPTPSSKLNKPSPKPVPSSKLSSKPAPAKAEEKGKKVSKTTPLDDLMDIKEG